MGSQFSILAPPNSTPKLRWSICAGSVWAGTQALQAIRSRYVPVAGASMPRGSIAKR